MFDTGLELHSPEFHFRRDQLDAVFPAVGALVALPHDDRGIAGTGDQIGEREPLLEVERLRQYDHAPVWVDDSRMRFDTDALAGFVVPPETHGDSGVHAAATALLVGPRTDVLGFTQLYRHFRLYHAMLELRVERVNGTNPSGSAKE